MAEQKNEENIVFLPWTVEPQPQTQAVILQQPSETHLRLDATTDKTAISSFALSVIIALILGGLATWLAYWYGRKSFDLTKQSFDAVMAQIKSSERLMLESNISLMRYQNDLKVRELKILNRNAILDTVRELISDNLYLAGNIQNQVEIGLNEIRKEKYNNFFQSRNHGDFKIALNNYQSSIKRIRVYLGNGTQYSSELNQHFQKMLLLSWDLYTADMHLPALSTSLDEWSREIRRGESLVEKYLNEEFKRIYQN
jgi:hypothetical protein